MTDDWKRCPACKEEENTYSWKEDGKEIFRCKECGFEWSYEKCARRERCPDCEDLIKRFGRENLKVCEICMHLYNDEISCACDEYSREGSEDENKDTI